MWNVTSIICWCTQVIGDVTVYGIINLPIPFPWQPQVAESGEFCFQWQRSEGVYLRDVRTCVTTCSSLCRMFQMKVHGKSAKFSSTKFLFKNLRCSFQLDLDLNSKYEKMIQLCHSFFTIILFFVFLNFTSWIKIILWKTRMTKLTLDDEPTTTVSTDLQI